MSSTGVQSREEDWLWGLICKARSGDQQAANDLVSEQKILKITRAIAASLRRDAINGDYKDVKEIQHEILLKLWRGIKTFTGKNEKEFEHWLWAIAKNMKKDDLRSIKREREKFDKNRPEDDDGSYIEGLCEQAFTDDLCGQIWISELLDTLTPQEREIFDKHCWEGKTLKEIAEDLKGTPYEKGKSTVDRHWKRIQKKLIEIIGGGKY